MRRYLFTPLQTMPALSEERVGGLGCGDRTSRAFTLVELIAVIGIVLLLAAMLMPLVKSMAAASNRTQGLSNLRQLMAGAVGHAVENWGYLPLTRWPGETIPYKSGVTTGTYWFYDIHPYVYGSGMVNSSGEKLFDGVFRSPNFRGFKNYGRAALPAAWDRIDFVNLYSWRESSSSPWNYMNVLSCPTPAKMPVLISGYNEGTAGITHSGTFEQYCYHPDSGGPAPSRTQLPAGTAWPYQNQILVGYADGRVEAVPYQGAESYDKIFNQK